MTEDEFISEIGKRHKTADLSGAVLNDIRNAIRQATDQQRTILFDYYVRNWRASGCPRAGFFSDELTKMGYAGKKNHDAIHGAWECSTCGTTFTLQSQGCPKCQARTEGKVVDASHPNVWAVQLDCWQCGIFHDKSGHKYGPSCEQWGKERNLPYCNDCRCKPCCIYQSNFVRNPSLTVGHTIEKNMPWITGGLNENDDSK